MTLLSYEAVPLEGLSKHYSYSYYRQQSSGVLRTVLQHTIMVGYKDPKMAPFKRHAYEVRVKRTEHNYFVLTKYIVQ